MVSLILWVVFGAIVGWLAGQVMGGSRGFIGNMAIGVVGAAIGGFLLNRQVAPSVFSLSSLLTAVVGAVILLAVVNLISRGRAR